MNQRSDITETDYPLLHIHIGYDIIIGYATEVDPAPPKDVQGEGNESAVSGADTSMIWGNLDDHDTPKFSILKINSHAA